MLTLTPAYDICPQGRTGQEASQAMLIHDNDNMSRLSTCLKTAHHFLLPEKQAIEMIEAQVRIIAAHWHSVCAEAALSEVDRNLFWGRQFLNPYAFYDLEGGAASLRKFADEVRS
jgi:serine/threonine-protein kinase HipA